MYAVKVSRSVQREKMAKTDTRTQSLIESLGVIRMIKLFSWEKPTKERIREKRATELKWLFKKKVVSFYGSFECTLTFFPGLRYDHGPLKVRNMPWHVLPS